MNLNKFKTAIFLSLILSATSALAEDEIPLQDLSLTPGLQPEQSSGLGLINLGESFNTRLGKRTVNGLGSGLYPLQNMGIADPTQALSLEFTFGLTSPSTGLRYGSGSSLVPCYLQSNPSMSCLLTDFSPKEEKVTEETKQKYNETSEGSDTVAYTDFTCTDVSPESLQKAAQDMNWGACFEGKLSYTRNSKNSEKELLSKDQQICGCLRGWDRQPAVQQVMAGNMGELVKKKSKEIPQQELNRILTGMMFQTVSLTGSYDLAAIWGHNLYDSSNEPGKSSLKFDPPDYVFADKVPYPDGQCFSPRHYFQVKQRPNRIVQEGLAEGTQFKEDDWNYRILQERYSKLMDLSLSDRERKAKEIFTVKEKLKFLSRNPLIKYAFGAQDTSDSFQASKLKILNAMNLLNNPECQSLSSECSKQYNETLTQAFHGEGVMKIIRNEARSDHDKRVEARRKKDLMTTKGDVTQKSIVNQFMTNYGLKSPDICEPDSPNRIECLEIYSGYCKTLDNYKDDILDMSNRRMDHRILDDLDQEIANEMNPDIATNEGFKRFNARHCGTPRKNEDGQEATFEEFLSNYCSDKSKEGCSKNSADDYYKLRVKWAELYPDNKAIARTSGADENEDEAAQNLFNGSRNGIVAEASAATTSNAKRNMGMQQSDDALADQARETARRDSGRLAGLFGGGAKSGEKADEKPFMVGWGQAVANTMGATPMPDSSSSFDEGPMMNYNNAYMTPPTATSQAVAEVPKVEQMSEAQRQEMLGQWQKEYDSWKKEKGGDMSQADVAKDSALRQEIATLRSLLAQQQQLSEQQFKMLNEAIASKAQRGPESEVARAEERAETKKQQSQFASAGRSVASVDEDSEAVRAAASVKEQKFTTSGANSGASTTTSVSAKRSGQSDSSSDSVAREEAKLVNLRRYADGSITIESAGPNAAGATGNAITVPVSDEQYRILQSNPNGLNLTQIEKSIPKDQIAKLEKSGEIIILLRNGSNPPFEVKVEKKDNRLVYSLKDKNGNSQAPVRRVFTRQALELQLKAER